MLQDTPGSQIIRYTLTKYKSYYNTIPQKVKIRYYVIYYPKGKNNVNDFRGNVCSPLSPSVSYNYNNVYYYELYYYFSLRDI